MITSIHIEKSPIAPCSLKTARVTTAGKLTRCMDTGQSLFACRGYSVHK